MNYIKGVVKKYFRSYNRTLKDGTKKIYKTEQVQVTIPKSDNIFEDKEEVIILPYSQAEEIEEYEEIQTALELFNSILTEENQKLSSELNKNRLLLNTSDSELNDLNKELDALRLELNETNKKIEFLDNYTSTLKNQIDENKNTISNLEKQLNDKNFIISDLNKDLGMLNDKLDSYKSNDGVVSEDINYSTLSEDTFEDYVDVQKEYISLLSRYDKLQKELYDEKIKVIHYKNLLDKFKNFILRIQ